MIEFLFFSSLLFLLFFLFSKKKKSAFSSSFETSSEKAPLSPKEKIQDFLLHQIKQPIFILDAENLIFFANRAAKEFFPHQIEIRKPIEHIFLEEQLIQAIKKARSTQKPIVEETLITFSALGKEKCPCCASFFPQERNFLAVLIEDISSDVHLEQTRRDFIMNSSHEFKTPLSIIKGYTDLLSKESDIDEITRKKFLQKIQKHIERLIKIVEKMLKVSVLENQSEPLQKEYFLIEDCINNVLELLSPLIEEKKCTIQNRVPKGKEIYGDYFYWEQIFFNLIENSLYANSEPIKINLDLKETKNQKILSFSDNGIGIAQKDIPFIFYRFSRFSDYPGNGMGLSIVKRAILAHGGDIAVKSAPHKCTTFQIILPQKS